ncbi:MAG: cell division ATP-binding protein FtsE [Acidobacteriota bacterium]
MIEFDRVSKSYGRNDGPLETISFRLQKGEFAFLTGPSGAGKTTLLKLIYREEQPTRGRVVVRGQELSRLSPGQVQVLRRRLGVVFQDGRLIPSRDVLENVVFVLRAMGLPARAQKERALAVLRWVGLTHKMRAAPRELSGGEQQRVAIARAIAADPEILLADEPTGNLDRDLSLEILDLFRRINGRGTTILIATHDLHLTGSLRRRQLHLEGGRLTEETPS